MSFLAVMLFRKFAAGDTRLLDTPNERSSHTEPVTRGAGVAIVLSVLGIYLFVSGSQANYSYVFAVLAIAVVSFLDDLYSVPLLIRLMVHTGAASFLVFVSGEYTGLTVPFSTVALTFEGYAPLFTVIFIVWTINAFNFMDGIDGIAATQGIGGGLGWTLIGISSGIASYSTLGAAILGVCAGFLFFNWQPARVFMGDVGSTFLGFTLGAVPIIGGSTTNRQTGLTVAIILLWLFLFDTILTRTWQIIRLQPFWRPHREHIYQRLVQSGRAHYVVSLFYGLYSVAVAIALAAVPRIGLTPLIVLLVLGPVMLLLWPRTKELT